MFLRENTNTWPGALVWGSRAAQTRAWDQALLKKHKNPSWDAGLGLSISRAAQTRAWGQVLGFFLNFFSNKNLKTSPAQPVGLGSGFGVFFGFRVRKKPKNLSGSGFCIVSNTQSGF